MPYRLVPRQWIPTPAVGQVWLDLSIPGRTLTINSFRTSSTGVRQAICTAFNPRYINPATRRTRLQRPLKIVEISAKRLRHQHIFDPHQRKRVFTGFVYLERVWVPPVPSGEEDFHTVTIDAGVVYWDTQTGQGRFVI